MPVTKPLTEFSKAVINAVGLSFAQSANHYCDSHCRLREACYASRIERCYTGLNRKLLRHYEAGPSAVIDSAIAELAARRRPVPWARLSVDGSLPARKHLPKRQWTEFQRKLLALVGRFVDSNIPVHIPVESPGKARTYRTMLKNTGVVVRRTSQANSVSELLQSTDHRAWVVAKRIHNACVTKTETAENTRLAHQYAQTIRAAGQSAIVCPAIAGNSKCGKCKACASAKVDVVLYPFHA